MEPTAWNDYRNLVYYFGNGSMNFHETIVNLRWVSALHNYIFNFMKIRRGGVEKLQIQVYKNFNWLLGIRFHWTFIWPTKKLLPKEMEIRYSDALFRCVKAMSLSFDFFERKVKFDTLELHSGSTKIFYRSFPNIKWDIVSDTSVTAQ